MLTRIASDAWRFNRTKQVELIDLLMLLPTRGWDYCRKAYRRDLERAREIVAHEESLERQREAY